MDSEFWHHKWRAQELGFHQSDINPFLACHIGRLSLRDSGRVFVPLCGKTRDIAWLRDRGLSVAGIEWVQTAVEQLFVDMKLVPKISQEGPLTRYRADRIDIFTGDIFDLSAKLLGPIDAVYDRAALVALPEPTRSRYAGHIRTLTRNARQLVICYEYDQSAVDGPPFAVLAAEMNRLYSRHYSLELLEKISLPNGFKGKCAAAESAWLLSPRP